MHVNSQHVPQEKKIRNSTAKKKKKFTHIQISELKNQPIVKTTAFIFGILNRSALKTLKKTRSFC